MIGYRAIPGWLSHRSQRTAGVLITVLASLLLAACQPVTPPAVPSSPEAAAASEQQLAITQGAAAFLRDNVLYLHDFAGGELLTLDQCTTPDCTILYPTWSPDGSRLLYYRGSWDSSAPQELRMADRSGNVRTIAQDIGQYRPAAWSPSGEQVAYLVATGRQAQPIDDLPAMIMEVWTQDVGDDGDIIAGSATQVGEIGFKTGCGGAGRSQAALVYEREGGFAYGYNAAIAIWAPNDLFLFSNSCASTGVGRFDLRAGTELAPYAGDLRSLVLSPDGVRWAAIDGSNQIVLGTPTSPDFTPLASMAQPELVFWGPVSGRLYYTSLEITGAENLMDHPDLLANTPPGVDVQFFDFTKPALHAYDPALSSEAAIYAGDDYAYARVTEASDAGVVFSAVESNTAMYNAIEQGILTVENQAQFAPGVDVLYLPPASSEPQLLAPDAAVFSLARK